jgi:hypothetical protein
MAKQKMRPVTRLGDLQVRFNQLSGIMRRSQESNVELVTIAIMRGEPVISLRTSKNSGIKPGSEVTPKPDEYPMYLTLARQGSVITKEIQQAGEEWRRLKPIIEKCDKPKQELMRAQVQASQAGARLAQLEAQIDAARSDMEAALANEKSAEAELGRVLDESNVD